MQVQVLPLVPNTRRGDVIVTFVAHNHSRLITLVEVQFLPPQLNTSRESRAGALGSLISSTRLVRFQLLLQISSLITLRLSGSKLTIDYGVKAHSRTE